LEKNRTKKTWRKPLMRTAEVYFVGSFVVKYIFFTTFIKNSL